MPLTNMEQVESYFSNPDNVHKLYVYEVVNFNNRIESIVSQNTNNFMKLKFVGIKKGIYEAQTFSPQVKILGDGGDVGLKINTDYVFISNDDFGFLERTNKIYLFTIWEPFKEDSEVYFITDNSVKALNELSEDDLDVIKLDDAMNLIQLYSIGLQNIKKLEVGKNSTINFKLVDELPDFDSGKNKITKVTYKLPINSLVQTIQLIGTIKNDLVDSGILYQDEQIDIDVSNNIGCVPLYIKYKNLNPKSNIDILNFSLSKQLPLKLFKKIITKESTDFDSIFDDFKENGSLPVEIEDLIILIKKLILSTWIYMNDFNIFDKKSNDFINYFNVVYANKKASEYNTNLIAQYEYKYPKMRQSIAYSYFKAICFSLSDVMITPYGIDNEKLSDAQKEILWFYIDCPIDVENVKQNFNSDGSFKDSLSLFIVVVDSKYFLINYDESKNVTLTNKKIKFNDVKNGNYLPKNQINKIDDEWYQVWLFMQSKDDVYEIVNNYFLSSWEVKEKTVYIDNQHSYPTEEECRKLLPPDARNIEIIYQKDSIVDTGVYIEKTCPIKSGMHPARTLLTPTSVNGLCKYSYMQNTGGRPHGPGGAPDRWETFYEYDRVSWDTIKNYRKTVTYRFETRYNFIDENVSYTASQLLNFLLTKNTYKYNEVDVSFSLSWDMQQNQWYISNIKEDYIFGLFNSASSMTINYLNEKKEEQSFVYEIKNSFQKIDNTNPLTRNKY